jgi:hypothetical protein
MPIDFTLTPEQQRLRADAGAFARDVLSKVGPATQDLLTPLARFAATRPFYEQTVAAGFLRHLMPATLGGQGTVLLGGMPEQAERIVAPFAAGRRPKAYAPRPARRLLGNFLPRHNK